MEIFAFVRSNTPISFNVELVLYEFCLHVCRLLCYIMYVTYIMCSFTTNANDMAL